MKQITNNQIEVNGVQCTLLDDRARDGMWVDVEDLTNVSSPTVEPVYVRFKHPDRMEVVWEISGKQYKDWTIVENPYKTDSYMVTRIGNYQACHYETRQRFILKEKEEKPDLSEALKTENFMTGKQVINFDIPIQSPDTSNREGLEEAANRHAIELIESHYLDEKEKGVLFEDELIEQFPDEWSLCMASFKAGWQQSQQVKPAKTEPPTQTNDLNER